MLFEHLTHVSKGRELLHCAQHSFILKGTAFQDSISLTLKGLFIRLHTFKDNKTLIFLNFIFFIVKL